MIRFPNPGSDIDSFIGIYLALFESLQDQSTFSLDDMSKVMIDRNLVTSSGYMGEEALIRSYRKDRSRDRLYNQSKMYSELFKVLGWIHPMQDSALVFLFTYLGAHVPVVKNNPSELFRQCILGIAYPNEILNVRGNHILRPFVTILRTMKALDNKISRDEMILGPLSLEDDRNVNKFNNMVETLKNIRGNMGLLTESLNRLSRERKISRTTMGNYTRFPNGVLNWSGWVKRERNKNIYGRSIPFYILTDEAKKLVSSIENLHDIRGIDLLDVDDQTMISITLLGFYQMLDRAGFEITEFSKVIEKNKKIVSRYLMKENPKILFSPFQELAPNYLLSIFPNVSGSNEVNQSANTIQEFNGEYIVEQLGSEVTLTLSNESSLINVTESIKELLFNCYKTSGTLEAAVEMIFQNYHSTNQIDFYPFIAELFNALGYRCECPRAGVNYQRWDAIIIDSVHTIPVEIKSPGEEEYLSLKSVRQALENKIILLSRKPYPTTPNTTSLVVGYNLPNDRSDLISLIHDFYNVFNIKIGVIDLRSLLILVGSKIIYGKEHDKNNFTMRKDFIFASDTEAKTI